MPTAALRDLLCNHHMYSSREGLRVYNHEADMRISSFVVDSVIRELMAQIFSFAAAIVDDGSTLLNGPFGSGKLLSLKEGCFLNTSRFPTFSEA